MFDEVDVFGVDNVCNLIMQGYSRYLIYRTSASRNSYPIATFNDVDATPTKAKNSFINWAKYTNPNVPYSITLYADQIVDTDEDQTPTRGPKKAFQGVAKFIFVLNEKQLSTIGSTATDQTKISDIDSIVKAAISQERSNWEKEQLLQELQELKQEVKELREQEPEPVGSSPNYMEILIGAITPLITGLFENKAAQISGTSNIDYLRTVLPEIDLLHKKLVELHKKDPDQFNLLIQNIKTVINQL